MRGIGVVPRTEVLGCREKTARLRGRGGGTGGFFALNLGQSAPRQPRTSVLGKFGVLLALTGTIAGAACDAAPVVVTPADAPALKRAIAGHKGRVVMVNFWATWCGPCVEEFPTLVKFAKANKKNGLDFLAVTADVKKDVPTKVVPFLVRQKYTGPAYLQRADDPETFINALDPTWQGELPRTLIYNRQGKLVKSLSGAQTEKTLGAIIKPLLKR